MHPGCYLLAVIVVAFTAKQVFTWLGARPPYDELISESFSMSGSTTVSSETAGEIGSMLTLAADRVVESQAFLVATNLLLTGLLSLSVWRLFRGRFEWGSQAVAFSAFVVAHTAFLETAGDASTEQKGEQSFDLSAPVSRKEAKERRKATSPEKSVSPSARGRGTFLDEHHNGESASEQA